MLAQVPKVDLASQWIWRAWWRLSDDRTMHPGGLGPSVPGRIPWTVVRAYCGHYGMTDGEMALMERCFADLDRVYLLDWQSKLPKGDG